MKEREVLDMDEHGSLGHPTRKALYKFILENPGTSFQFIRNVLRIPEGTLRYHLQHLQRSNRIVREKNGKELCYYSKFHRDHPECHLEVELSPKQKLLLDLIREDPGATRKELMSRSRLSRRELNYSLRRLRDLKLIWKKQTVKGEGFEVISKDTFKDEMFKMLVDRLLTGELTIERFRTLRDRLERI
ncbi:MAG: helix-turn-helix domain-containing protein [Thermoplasmatota archaeon]